MPNIDVDHYSQLNRMLIPPPPKSASRWVAC